MDDAPQDRPIYGGGLDAVLARMEGRRDPFRYAAGEGLPAADTDLDALACSIVGDPDSDPAEAPPFRSSYHRKRHALRRELQGQSELCFLHGLTVAHLRKRSWPDHAPRLFLRLWEEQGDHLLARLDARWLVSAATTFGDHGATAAQRATGLALSTFFAAMKLYETERLFSGSGPATAFPRKGRKKGPLPLEMDGYALDGGGLDVNTVGRLWQEAQADPVMRPLAEALLTRLIHDRRSVLARLSCMRAKTLRWGVICTAGPGADPAQVRGWAAWHLARGAAMVRVFSADPAMPAALAHPDVTVAPDPPARAGEDASATRNATAALAAAQTAKLAWLAHLTPRDYLDGTPGVAQALSEADWRAAWLRLGPDADPRAVIRPGKAAVQLALDAPRAEGRVLPGATVPQGIDRVAPDAAAIAQAVARVYGSAP